jgi:hypothetical protein
MGDWRDLGDQLKLHYPTKYNAMESKRVKLQSWTKVRVLYLAAEREEIELRCLLTNNLSCALHMPTHT